MPWVSANPVAEAVGCANCTLALPIAPEVTWFVFGVRELLVRLRVFVEARLRAVQRVLVGEVTTPPRSYYPQL